MQRDIRWRSMRQLLDPVRTAYKSILESPPLPRLQFAVAILALFWAAPFLVIAIIFWDPIASYLLSETRAAWAGAIGSIAAAWAAVWAATHPQKVRRREEQLDGATEIIANQNLVATLRDELFAVAYGAETRAVQWMKATTAQSNAFSAIMSRIAANGGKSLPLEEQAFFFTSTLPNLTNEEASYGESPDAFAYRTASVEFQAATKDLTVTVSDIQKIRLQLQTINAQLIRRFDLKIATRLFMAQNQLRGAEDLALKPPMIQQLKDSLDATIAHLDAFTASIGDAQAFLDRGG